ncbi:SCP2 sterol-binding domain-containing protein [Marinomonas ostreistagni]|uniref:SCP2 sterol-binding domain-containing protein n=1 Tax=Marinomonas ostreistagni TaxID=359209 RepID=A0ABS0Z9E4_9GAMM|nr:SCP2 sterol-binding domain-containing protein [Marinomonas ostreistagni]MBJ7550053.1 SCP2 sterol-binding domain-containing protein [Marinomonas ostreistagni]
MSNAKDIFDTMLTRFDRDAASEMDAIFQFELDDADSYFVTISEGTATLEQGEHDDATVTLGMDTDTLSEVMSGELDGMQAFMQGKIRADGDIMLATKLTEIFPTP